jgi:hypothetical protein
MRPTTCLAIPALLALLIAPCLSLAGEEAPPPSALEARLAKLDEMGAADAYKLGLELAAAGNEEGARRAYERVLATEPEHRAARRALGYDKVGDRWLKGDELFRARGFIHHGGRWMTALEFAEATRPAREAAEQKAGESRVLGLLAMVASEDEERVKEARRRMALEEPRFKLAPLAKALRCNPVSLRVYAAEELARLDDPLGVPALLKRAIHDPEEKVRIAAVDALREIGEPSTVHPLGRALESRYAEVRARAADALGRLGDALAAPYVIRKWEARSGDFPRVYLSTVRQISYIQDFDVEVAQTSFIADPIVGVLQEGAVQAMKVLATEQTFYTIERVAYEGALKNLSGEDLGSDVRAWRRWWNENEGRLLEQRAVRLERESE